MDDRSLNRRLLLTGALVSAVAMLSIACDGSTVATPRPQEGTPPPDTENIYVVVPGDQLLLNGRLFGAGNETLVVLSHMRPSDQTAWFPFAEELADQGYAALTLNFRGYGESEGSKDFDKLTDDLTAALRYMGERGWRDVFLIGASMGGTASLVLAEELELRGVVALSAPAVFEDQDALDAAPGIDEPKLFIASEGDTAAIVSLDELLAAAAEPKESEVYAGRAHGTDLFEGEHNAAVRQRILQFLRDNGGP